MFQSKSCIEKAYKKENKINKNLKTQTKVIPSAIEQNGIPHNKSTEHEHEGMAVYKTRVATTKWDILYDKTFMSSNKVLS